MVVDSHQHFWHFQPERDGWMTGVLRQDYLPPNLAPILAANNVDYSIAVQAAQSEAETTFLLDCAEQQECVAGVVGWVDLLDRYHEDSLDEQMGNPYLVGLRHIVEVEADGFLAQAKFIDAVSRLQEWNLAYDLLIAERQLPQALIFLDRVDEAQTIILDHLAKPKISSHDFNTWTKQMMEVAQHGNVAVKVSGLVTEADRDNWQAADLTPYFEVALEAFSPRRLLYGSDWPVCELAGGYAPQYRATRDYFERLSADEQTAIFGGNAVRLYGLCQF